MSNISAANSANTLGKPLHGGVALITGGSRGIGQAIAKRLAALGAAVGICGRDEEKLRLASRGCNESGGYSLTH
jgi:NAD(P)-dependent dehydrogenase (short-subunit alcohol dehydrogenase family)